MKGGEHVNLGIMQISKVRMNPVTQTKMKNTIESNGFRKTEGKFDEVFNKVMSHQMNRSEVTSENANENDIDLDKLTELLNSNSVEDLLEALGIAHDEGFYMIDGLDGLQSIDEFMNLQDILTLLGMEQNQHSNGNIADVWQLIQFVNEEAPNLINQITTALQGEHKVTAKEAEQFLQLLKLAQLIGKNSDLLNSQLHQLETLKEVMSKIAESVKASQENLNTSTQTATKGTLPLQGFQQVLKQTEVLVDPQIAGSTQTPSANVPKTLTITLPSEKGAQGEALVKEVQQVISRGQISNSPGTMKILLKLYPENLGSIRIEIMQKDGVLSARLLASTHQAKELLDSQIHQLKNSFAQANIQMDRIDIVQSLQEADRNQRDQNLFSNLFKQEQDQEDDHDEQQDEEGEQVSFQDYLINEGV